MDNDQIAASKKVLRRYLDAMGFMEEFGCEEECWRLRSVSVHVNSESPEFFVWIDGFEVKRTFESVKQLLELVDIIGLLPKDKIPSYEPVDQKLTKTARGFAVYHFLDRYNENCSLQESSLATEDCIWMGVNRAPVKMLNPDPDGTGWVDCELPAGAEVFSRMHLTRNQVKTLLPMLIHFVETGELGDPDSISPDETVGKQLQDSQRKDQE